MALLLHNPALLKPEELKKLFVVRQAEYSQVLSSLGDMSPSLQHILFIGDRGMGKTTLLHRIAHAVAEDPALAKVWLPVCLDEEQYNIGELADFWLNCLEKIAEETRAPEVGEIVDDLTRENRGAALEEAGLLRLRHYAMERGKRLLLLVDNLGLLLERIDKEGSHRLREILQTEKWILLIGASAQPVLSTFDYSSPFYDLFRAIQLAALNAREMVELLMKLGQRFQRESEIAAIIERRGQDLAVLHTLIGGNVRTAAHLFLLLLEDSATPLPSLLNRLFDQYTMYYKDMVESLPAQGQRVLDSLARAWNPVTADEIAKELRIDRGSASSQLHRLVDRDFAVKVQLPQRSIGFQMRDRLFNLWYLMRGGRRQRRQLYALLEFLQLLDRRRAAQSTARRFIDRLLKMSLVSEADIEEAREESRRPKDSLWSSASQKATLLASYLGHDSRADQEAIRLLEGKPDPFSRFLRAGFLEKSGDRKQALQSLAVDSKDALSAWFLLERARLLLEMREVGDLGDLVMPLRQSSEVPPAEVADLAVLIAQKAGSELGWLAQALLSAVVRHAPDEIPVQLSACQVELALEHQPQGAERFGKALLLASQDKNPLVSYSRELLDLALRIAADQPSEVASALATAGLTEEWVPLRYALDYLREKDPSKKPEYLVRLAPELRTFTQDVIDRILQCAPSATPYGQNGSEGQ
jgi:DNA-binding MarR family transcriptional regulator